MGVTLKDIAKELGVSVNTVSRALRDMSDISKETKTSVKQIADKLCYRRNISASYLRTKKSHIIGVVVPDICNPVFSGIFKGIELVCKKNGYNVMLGNSNENAVEEMSFISSMNDHGVDGILLIPSMKNSNIIRYMNKASIPFVILGRKFPDISTNLVVNDDALGGYLAAEHLYKIGHKEFIYLAGPMYISSSNERCTGFSSFLKEQSLPDNALQVYECDGTKTGGYQIMKEVLTKNDLAGKSHATAIFCFSDYVACGVYAALSESGIHIPDDISVIGYDNNDLSDIMSPALTTIDLYKFRLGHCAAELILDLLNNPTSKSSGQINQVIIPPSLIVRQSTASPLNGSGAKTQGAILP
jgi:LacI family transcriptional regulator